MEKEFLRVRTLWTRDWGFSAVVFQDDWGNLIVRENPTRNSVSTDSSIGACRCRHQRHYIIKYYYYNDHLHVSYFIFPDVQFVQAEYFNNNHR